MNAPAKKRVAPASPQRSPIVSALVESTERLKLHNAEYKKSREAILDTHRRQDALIKRLEDENRRAEARRARRAEG
jgi:hypothetical protein